MNSVVREDAHPNLLATGIAVVLLAVSLASIALAPMLMPDSYSIVTHSVSESAAQRINGAWLARAGLLLLAFAVLLIAALVQDWGAWGRLTHRVYGVGLVATAAFSHRPWEPIPFDAFEDTLHSVAATAVGVAFVVGVTIVAFRRPATDPGGKDLRCHCGGPSGDPIGFRGTRADQLDRPSATFAVRGRLRLVRARSSSSDS